MILSPLTLLPIHSGPLVIAVFPKICHGSIYAPSPEKFHNFFSFQKIFSGGPLCGSDHLQKTRLQIFKNFEQFFASQS